MPGSRRKSTETLAESMPAMETRKLWLVRSSASGAAVVGPLDDYELAVSECDRLNREADAAGIKQAGKRHGYELTSFERVDELASAEAQVAWARDRIELVTDEDSIAAIERHRERFEKVIADA